jgi:hypothetical protein
LQGKDALGLDASLAALGGIFSQLQEKRHQADYDPAPFRHYFDETLTLVNQARSAIATLNSLPTDKRRALATLVLFKSR